MKRTIIPLVSAACVLLLAETARGDVPGVINFQGRLADATGTPLNGDLSIQFSLYDASAQGNACYTATPTVTISGGLFSVNLGTGTALTDGCDFGRPYWMELQVTGDQPMVPRVLLTSVPYAITTRALVVNGSAAAVGNAAGNLPLSNGTLNQNLNADKLGGYDALSPLEHPHRGSGMVLLAEEVWLGPPHQTAPGPTGAGWYPRTSLVGPTANTCAYYGYWLNNCNWNYARQNCTCSEAYMVP